MAISGWKRALPLAALSPISSAAIRLNSICTRTVPRASTDQAAGSYRTYPDGSLPVVGSTMLSVHLTDAPMRPWPDWLEPRHGIGGFPISSPSIPLFPHCLPSDSLRGLAARFGGVYAID
jgi:hypothetical protein